MLAGMTTGESGGDSVVRITQREVYDIVLRMSSKLDRVLQEVDERSRQSDEHEGRLKALELVQAASAVKVDALRTTTEQHSLDLAKIAAAGDRRSPRSASASTSTSSTCSSIARHGTQVLTRPSFCA